MKTIVLVAAISAIIISALFLIHCQTNRPGIESNKKAVQMKIRQPAVAGQFYPADKTKLQEQIDKLLKAASLDSSVASLSQNDEKKTKVLIVPHAGYDYSGPVAAAGFEQLVSSEQIENQPINRVILIGSSHQEWFDGAAIDDNDLWETPLGKVEVDKEFAEKIATASHSELDSESDQKQMPDQVRHDDDGQIFFSSEPHRQEHSLEVQIPFLQTVLKDFKIVPILLGQINNQAIEQLSNTIFDNLDDKTLVVISTDLSHYPKYDDANKVDNETINAILSGDVSKFEQTLSKNMAVGYSNLQTCACADKAIKVSMLIAKKLSEITLEVSTDFTSKAKNNGWQLIKYANSGDSPIGDKSQVVGYAAITYTAPTNSHPELVSGSMPNQVRHDNLYQSQHRLLLEIARETLEAKLQGKSLPTYEITDPKLNEKLGVFVTLNENGQLRGCIGNFEPETLLWQTVQNQTIESALHDPRFNPVTYDELKNIEIEISVLSKPEKIDDWKKIELGKHGVVLKNGNRGGTFLPQVATETGWSLEEFLGELCSQKAGLSRDCYKDPKTEILTYTAEVFREN